MVPTREFRVGDIILVRCLLWPDLPAEEYHVASVTGKGGLYVEVGSAFRIIEPDDPNTLVELVDHLVCVAHTIERIRR